MVNGVTIAIAVLNSERTIYKCLSSIASQIYPKKRLEILILDGGSTDKTVKIIEGFRNLPIKILTPGFRDNQEARRLIGFKKAKFDLVCVFDSDNYMGGEDWLTRMVEPMEKHSNLAGSFTLHYNYDSKQTTFNRYVAFFGGHDPVSYYLNKTDRLKWTDREWTRKEQIVKKYRKYTILKFNKDNFPTLGCNGFMVRKNFLHLKGFKPTHFFHTDVLFDLLDDGRNEYAVLDVSLTHDTGANIWSLVKKRVEYMALHHVKLQKYRRYKVYDNNSPTDRANLIKFIFYSSTFIEPFLESFKGFLKVRDFAWFLHPVACFFFLVAYGFVVVKSAFLKR